MSQISDNHVAVTPLSPVRIWSMAARPATLPAAVVPVLVGAAAAYAAHAFNLLVFVAALLASVLIQVGTNLANDYFDFKKGADTAARVGPVRVTQSGLLAPETVRNGMVAAFGVAGLLGLYLAYVGGWPIVIIGLLSIASGVLYTGGPWPLGYHGFGDLFVFIFFGLVAVCGTTYLMLGRLTPLAIAVAIPVGMLVTAIIVVNNLRDEPTDRLAGKHTLAVLCGPGFARAEYFVLVLGAYLALPIIWWLGLADAWILLPWLTLPLAMPLLRLMRRERGAALNLALKGTGRLHLLFGVLLALGIAI